MFFTGLGLGEVLMDEEGHRAAPTPLTFALGWRKILTVLGLLHFRVPQEILLKMDINLGLCFCSFKVKMCANVRDTLTFPFVQVQGVPISVCVCGVHTLGCV